MKIIYTLLLLFFSSISLNATTYTSTQNGNWMSFTTWSPMGVPLPGDDVIINHNVSLDTSFAYTTGSITVNSGGSLIQNNPTRDIWLNGTNAAFTNHGTTTVRYFLLSSGAFTNTGFLTFNAAANWTVNVEYFLHYVLFFCVCFFLDVIISCHNQHREQELLRLFNIVKS